MLLRLRNPDSNIVIGIRILNCHRCIILYMTFEILLKTTEWFFWVRTFSSKFDFDFYFRNRLDSGRSDSDRELFCLAGHLFFFSCSFLNNERKPKKIFFKYNPAIFTQLRFLFRFFVVECRRNLHRILIVFTTLSGRLKIFENSIPGLRYYNVKNNENL